jgi:hypothetical protein
MMHGDITCSNILLSLRGALTWPSEVLLCQLAREAGAGLVGWPVEMALGDGGWQRSMETVEEGIRR